MSKFTDFLNLFMWDSIEDSEEEFNIDKALNDNWKKIDTKVKTHVTSVNEEINNFKEETNQKIENIQALPTGGTKGQVLTKQSETDGDANWEDIEANEVFVGNEEEAPNSAKIIVEEDDFVEGSTLGKAEVYVGAEEPTTGEKVWFNKNKNSIYVRNSNGVYEEFTKKSEEVYSTEEQIIGTWIDGKPLYRKVINAKPTISNSSYQTISIKHNISDLKNVYKCNAFLHNTGNTQTYILPVETSATQAIGISEINSTNIIMYSKNDTWSGWIAEIILEYTKTTD